MPRFTKFRTGWRRYGAAAVVAMALAIAGPRLTAGWLQEDIAVCTDPAHQQYPRISSDGSGGAFIAWHDGRGPNISAQRLDPSGTPLWRTNGVDASLREGTETGTRVAPDGFGNAFISFQSDSLIFENQMAPPLVGSRLSLSKIGTDGTLLWTKRITTVQPASMWECIAETRDTLIPDGSGGVIVIWQTGHGVYSDPYCYYPPCFFGWTDYDVNAQRFDADGNRLWGSTPIELCTCSYFQGFPQAVKTDSAVTVAWRDKRNSSAQSDIYAQRIDLNGNRLWNAQGVPVCVDPGDQILPQIATDSVGGVFIAWIDYRTKKIPHVYAQRLDAAGAGAWTPDGLPVCTADGTKNELQIITPAPGRCIITWTNIMNSRSTLFAQELDLNGAALWTSNGKQLSDGANNATNLNAMPDGAGGAVLAWQDSPVSGWETALIGIWGLSSTNIFAVGKGGLCLHYDGTQWNDMGNTVLYDLNAVWGSSSNDVFAVGYAGVILHYDGSSWSRMTSGLNASLYGVWGTAWNNVFAVGDRGTILRYDGSSWSKMDYAESDLLTAVHGNSGTSVFAVGQGSNCCHGTILYYDGVAWQRTTNQDEAYWGVWVSPDNHVFVTGFEQSAVHYGGIVLHNDGDGWDKTLMDFKSNCQGVWGNQSTDVYVVSVSHGSVLHYDGAQWTRSKVTSGQRIYNVWGTFGSDIWVVGETFLIRHFDDPNWITQYENDSDIFVQRIRADGYCFWREFGAPASVSVDDEVNPRLAYDPAGYALLAWQDNRGGDYSIYSRKVSISRGPIIATELLDFRAQLLERTIRVSWRLSELDDGAAFVISRARCPERDTWVRISPEVARENLSFSFIDATVEADAAYRYRVQVSGTSGSRVLFETDDVSVPGAPLTLQQNFPNPFNPSTTIRYYLPSKCHVELQVHDVAGRLVATLVDAELDSGTHTIEWKGTDTRGDAVASGIYFYRLRAGKMELSRKMVLLR